GKLKMEIFVTRGMGYEMVENRENRKKEIGYIEIDSIFSPVRVVGLNVENTRVGKMTNWDKLTLDITTNGVISPEQAFNEAVKILINQFDALTKTTEELSAVESAETEETA
ncbi:MAG TPA: DNA-directed RNA polymerase subunit alpha, partial [bacterium]|nr:DNA-directed RNA polymerase subunit alpha [bacterium]